MAKKSTVKTSDAVDLPPAPKKNRVRISMGDEYGGGTNASVETDKMNRKDMAALREIMNRCMAGTGKKKGG